MDEAVDRGAPRHGRRALESNNTDGLATAHPEANGHHDGPFRALFESAADAMVISDARGSVLLANESASDLLGYERSALRQMTVESLMPERYRPAHMDWISAFVSAPDLRRKLLRPETFALRRDGSEVPVEITLTKLHTADGVLVSAAMRDVSAVREAQLALREAEERFRRAFDEAPIGTAILDLDLRFARVNDAWCEITGYARDQLLQTTLVAVLHPGDRIAEEVAIGGLVRGEAAEHHTQRRVVRSDGQHIWTELYVTLQREPDAVPRQFLAQVQDASERHHEEGRLRDLADRDSLTGLLNRRSFNRELDGHLARNARYGGGGAVVLVDLDHFKRINDTLGHNAGDKALIQVARALRSRLRDSDIAARMGGDEFAVLLPHTDADGARRVAEQLLEVLRGETMEVLVGPHPLRASAGVAAVEDRAPLTAEDVLMQADGALYAAKDAGRDRVYVHAEEDLATRARTRRHLAARIELAVARNEFALAAQPVLDLKTRQPDHHELLVRLIDNNQLVPAADFVFSAERLGLARKIDQWVIRRAIALLAVNPELCFEVNLSNDSLEDPQLAELIAGELSGSAIEPSRLILSSNETAASLGGNVAPRQIASLQARGCRFALDNFGDGYGSLNYLSGVPAAFIKFNGRLVTDCREDPAARLLINALVMLAHGLDRKVIATRIPNEETARLLAELGVDYGQGFPLARPTLITP